VVSATPTATPTSLLEVDLVYGPSLLVHSTFLFFFFLDEFAVDDTTADVTQAGTSSISSFCISLLSAAVIIVIMIDSISRMEQQQCRERETLVDGLNDNLQSISEGSMSGLCFFFFDFSLIFSLMCESRN
jgi:hypothetical protein